MRVDRDTIVTRGKEAQKKSHYSPHYRGPWLYKAKVKSGTRATKNVEDTFFNIPHLIGEMIIDHAREGETLNVYAIARVMKGHLRSQREDI